MAHKMVSIALLKHIGWFDTKIEELLQKNMKICVSSIHGFRLPTGCLIYNCTFSTIWYGA